MNKKLKLGLILCIPALLIAVGLTLFLTLEGSSDPAVITLAQYEQVEQEMPYDEVVRLLGKGTLDSEAGEKGDESYTAIYIWKGQTGGSRAVIVFHGGFVASKTHVGLT